MSGAIRCSAIEPSSSSGTAIWLTRSPRFHQSLDGRLAKHAVDFVRTGKLRVAYDMRHVQREDIGGRAYAFNLAKALGDFPQIALTFSGQ